VLACIAYAVAITWENRKRARQAHDLNLTESEKIELGVSFCLSEYGEKEGVC